MTSIFPGQMQFDLFAAEHLEAPAGDLCDRRRMPYGDQAGAARLLRALVQHGLAEDASVRAAALALELDREAEREAV